MATTAEALALALKNHQAGRLPEAEALYRQILQADPNHADALHLLGVLDYQMGKHDRAIEHITHAIRLRPAVPHYHNNLGEVYRARGQLAEATDQYQQAVRLKPEYPEAHNNLGEAHREQGQTAEAEERYRQALRLRPDYPEAHNNLGIVLMNRGELADAVAHLQQALRFKPDYAEAHNNLGLALQVNGELPEAMAEYQEALRLKPGYVAAHANLGTAFHEQRRLSEAVSHYQEALRLQPDCAEAHSNFAEALQDQGQLAEATAHYQVALRLKPANRLRLVLATLLPVIYDSVEHLQSARQALIDRIRRLRREGIILDLANAMAPPPFFLVYQGQNDRDIMRDLGQLCLGEQSAIENRKSKIKNRTAGADKIRVGFLSAYFKQHTIGRLMHGLIANLSREDFTVIVLSAGGHRDELAQSIRRSADHFVTIPRNLPAARRLIVQQQLDILFYTDLGMAPLTYTLAFSRLAPIQCATWGHPSTSGLATIDYYLSSELFESEDADEHYTEKLIRLKSIPAYAYRPQGWSRGGLTSRPSPGTLKGRADFGLPERCHLYSCLQSISKLHPGYDEIIAGILRQDPASILVLSRGRYPHGYHLLHKRFSVTLPDVLPQIRFVDWQSYDDFLNLNAVSDVVLDPIYFGGGRTSYENLALGLPIVTMPTQMLPGRMALGMHKKMGVMDCVADSPQNYVEIAVKLGSEPGYREHIRSKILAANDVLYEDMEVVRELERFFKGVVRGEPHS